MGRKNKKIAKHGILCALLFICHLPFAQQKDSLAVYKKIKELAGRHKITQRIYEAVFVEPKPIEYPSVPVAGTPKIVNPYLKYDSRIIRKVIITVYDPFGYSVDDTTRRKLNATEKAGNHFHVTTRKWVIANKILFGRNDSLNPLSLSESERLLRQAPYVTDARIFVTETSSPDSVDVHVIVQDKWSVTIPAGASPTSANARFRDQNFLGLGQQFEQYAELNQPNRAYFNGFYTISNISNTYISSTAAYQTGKDQTQVALSFDRPFYSPLAKWAGGAYAAHTQQFYHYTDNRYDASKTLNLLNYSYDFWLGKNIKFNHSKSLFNQSENMIVAARYYGTTYYNRPKNSLDTRWLFPTSHTFIGNVGFAVQQYYKDKFIYRFGANEDVPEGLIAQFLYGLNKTGLNPMRYYLGTEIGRARHFDFGYLSATFSYGIFFNSYSPNDVSNGYKFYYFSDLLRLGKWYIRQFVNLNFVYGDHKQPAEAITLTTTDLYGFSSGNLTGNTKAVLQSQTVAFAPYNIVGFRLAPVFSAGFGALGDQTHPVYHSNLFQGYSLGIMFRNENLLTSTFQVSFGFYPFFPGGQRNNFMYNPITSFTLRVRTFSVAKPSFLSF